jgi:hypothetical protein
MLFFITGEYVMANYGEEFKGEKDRYAAHPDSDHKEKSVESETRDLPMHIVDPMTKALDSNKSHMTRAVEHLNRETQRGEHAPMVGGYKHDHTMR